MSTMMEHQLINLKKYTETAYSIKNELFNLRKSDMTQDQFKTVFNQFGVVVDSGQQQLFNLYKEALSDSPYFMNKIEEIVVNAIAVSNEYYTHLNGIPELLSYQPMADGLSSVSLKNQIVNRLSHYQDNLLDIKSMSNSGVMKSLKSTLNVSAYEDLQKDLTSIFDKHGVSTDYEINKHIIKASKNIDVFPIRGSVIINHLVSQQIKLGLMAEEKIIKDNINTPEKNNNGYKKGIFIA